MNAGRGLSWAPALVVMGTIFYLSSIPGDQIHLPDFKFSDKVVHALAYSVLGFALAARHALRRRLGGPAGTAAVGPSGFDYVSFLIGSLYGVSDEIHQLFTPLRQYDYADMAADALGVAAACLLWRYWGKVGSKKVRGQR